MTNKIRTSKKIASIASRKLKNKKTAKSTKRLAGSALRNRAK